MLLLKLQGDKQEENITQWFYYLFILKVEATGNSQMLVPRKLHAMIEKTIFKLHHCKNSNLKKKLVVLHLNVKQNGSCKKHNYTYIP